MEINGIAHVMLTVSDFEACRPFYHRILTALGLQPVIDADGMLYCLDESKGTVVLVEASPKGWNEKGRFTLSPQTEKRSSQGKVWTHPVVVDGKLYLRDQELLYCYDVKGRG